MSNIEITVNIPALDRIANAMEKQLGSTSTPAAKSAPAKSAPAKAAKKKSAPPKEEENVPPPPPSFAPKSK